MMLKFTMSTNDYQAATNYGTLICQTRQTFVWDRDLGDMSMPLFIDINLFIALFQDKVVHW